MQREIGKATNCPNCNGEGKHLKRQCPVCNGEKRVEAQERLGELSAPAGSWLPTRTRGRTGYVVCLFGSAIERMTR